MLQAFDHVNLRTTRLTEMIAWYRDILGLVQGKRPDFGFPGAWMYLGDRAVVHLVAAKVTAQNDDLQIEHFAFSANGLSRFVNVLKAAGTRYYLAEVPGFGITQVNVFDPDGNHLHIDFPTPPSEE